MIPPGMNMLVVFIDANESMVMLGDQGVGGPG